MPSPRGSLATVLPSGPIRNVAGTPATLRTLGRRVSCSHGPEGRVSMSSPGKCSPRLTPLRAWHPTGGRWLHKVRTRETPFLDGISLPERARWVHGVAWHRAPADSSAEHSITRTGIRLIQILDLLSSWPQRHWQNSGVVLLRLAGPFGWRPDSRTRRSFPRAAAWAATW